MVFLTLVNGLYSIQDDRQFRLFRFIQICMTYRVSKKNWYLIWITKVSGFFYSPCITCCCYCCCKVLLVRSTFIAKQHSDYEFVYRTMSKTPAIDLSYRAFAHALIPQGPTQQKSWRPCWCSRQKSPMGDSSI
jgi:hypothetical protein